MQYHECPNCGANLDPGEKCDCHKELSIEEASRIYNTHKGDAVDLMIAAYALGYEKATKNAAQDADTSQSGNEHQEPNGPKSHPYCTTGRVVLQAKGGKT